jgi:hypothetical protein
VVRSGDERISPRLRDALVADQVKNARTIEEVHYALADRPADKYDWTHHLARQLGFRYTTTRSTAGLHDTLIVLIPELDRMVGNLPLPSEDTATCDHLAHAATDHLSDAEVLATLLAGPVHWQRVKVPACEVEKLDDHLRPELCKLFASALGRLFDRWNAWDLRTVQREVERREAKAREERGPRKPLTPEEARKRRDERGWTPNDNYRPPGRVT